MLTSTLKRTLAILMCLGFVAGQIAFAAEPASRIKVRDIALAGNGQLAGKIVNQQGSPVGGQQVIVYHDKNVVAKAISDKQGKFLISKLRGGNHTIKTNQTAELCRLWTEKAAPPAAAKQILLVSDGQAVRGQYADSYGSGLFGTGTLMTGGIATAGVLGAVWGFNHGLDRQGSTTVIDSGSLDDPASP